MVEGGREMGREKERQTDAGAISILSKKKSAGRAKDKRIVSQFTPIHETSDAKSYFSS